MRFLKKYKMFKEDTVAAPERRTAEPKTKPGTKPGTKPSRPSPIRRTKPGVSPKPKADKNGMPQAEAEDVIEKFAELTNQKTRN